MYLYVYMYVYVVVYVLLGCDKCQQVAECQPAKRDNPFGYWTVFPAETPVRRTPRICAYSYFFLRGGRVLFNYLLVFAFLPYYRQSIPITNPSAHRELDDNLLSGTIPSAIGQCSQLATLCVAHPSSHTHLWLF